MSKGRRKSTKGRGRKNCRERGRRRSIESMRRRKRVTVHDCITKSQHFSLTFKQRAFWKLKQNIRATNTDTKTCT